MSSPCSLWIRASSSNFTKALRCCRPPFSTYPTWHASKSKGRRIRLLLRYHKIGFYHQTQQDSTKKGDSKIKAQQDSTIQFEVINQLIIYVFFIWIYFFQKLLVQLQALRTCHIVFHPACIASRTGFNLNFCWFRFGWQLTLKKTSPFLLVGFFKRGEKNKTRSRPRYHTGFYVSSLAPLIPKMIACLICCSKHRWKPPAFWGLDIFHPFQKKQVWNLDSEVYFIRFTVQVSEKKQPVVKPQSETEIIWAKVLHCEWKIW